ncbi:hypothetical protein I3760_03G120600 [Carya illinoinensis]|nr:hypothetical protein I3760_03G120600 [Carya illinoinensis]
MCHISQVIPGCHTNASISTYPYMGVGGVIVSYHLKIDDTSFVVPLVYSEIMQNMSNRPTKKHYASLNCCTYHADHRILTFDTRIKKKGQCQKDFKYLKIQDILKAAGVRRPKDLNSPLLPASNDEEAQSAQPIIEEQPRHGNWIDETRGTLMLVASVIATVTFQVGLNPPGGVRQQDFKNGTDAAGTSIFLSQDYDNGYQYFLYFNTNSFVAALSILLVVISGFPLRNKFFIWFLSLTMFIAIWAMALIYFNALYVVNPTYFEGDYLPVIYYVVLMAASAVHIIRRLSWIGKLLLKFTHWLITKRPAKDAINV